MTFLVAIFGAVLAASASSATSESYGFAQWREKAGPVVVVLDSYVPSLRHGEPFLPVPVAIGIETGGPTIRIAPGSFSLVGADGVALRAAPYEDVLGGYTKLEADLDLVETRHLSLGERFATAIRVQGDFYPPVGSRRTRAGSVEIGARTWFRSVLYFPPSPSGAPGIVTLRIEADGLAGPVEVRFPLRENEGRR